MKRLSGVFAGMLLLLVVAAAIDAHVAQAPAAEAESVERLTACLIRPARTDREKARAIYRWLARAGKPQPHEMTDAQRAIFFDAAEKKQSPEVFLRRLRVLAAAERRDCHQRLRPRLRLHRGRHDRQNQPRLECRPSRWPVGVGGRDLGRRHH